MTRYLLLLLCAPLLFAQGDEIRAMLKNSEATWNRGDLAAFASDYEDSPETTFIGKEITHGGVQAILDRYRRGYPTPEAMGTLTFSAAMQQAVSPSSSTRRSRAGRSSMTTHRSHAKIKYFLARLSHSPKAS